MTPNDLDEFCQSTSDLADYKRPLEYVFLEEVPKNPTGKINRTQLERKVNDE